MTIYDEAWAAEEAARRARLAEEGLYKPDDERSSCGVGLVVSIDGQSSRETRGQRYHFGAVRAVVHQKAWVDAAGLAEGPGEGLYPANKMPHAWMIELDGA